MLGIILTIPFVTLASERNIELDASQIRQGALAEANGDTAMAFILLSTRTSTLLDNTNVLQAELRVSNNLNDRYKTYYGLNEKSWLEDAWDSDAVKVILFLGGVWLGTEIKEAVN